MTYTRNIIFLLLMALSQVLSGSGLISSHLTPQKIHCQASISAGHRHWVIIREAGLVTAQHIRPWSLIHRNSPLLTIDEDAGEVSRSLTAPVAGILTPYAREIFPGTRLRQGEHITDIIQLKDLLIKVEPGIMLPNIMIGQQIELLTPKLNWQTRISHISGQDFWLTAKEISGDLSKLKFDISQACELNVH